MPLGSRRKTPPDRATISSTAMPSRSRSVARIQATTTARLRRSASSRALNRFRQTAAARTLSLFLASPSS
ncbi:hypothetical protein HYQ46_008486 [Verticillium longisporum]|nr:hypothetical protein HYQ46_008486 [Verticillium longisporum]